MFRNKVLYTLQNMRLNTLKLQPEHLVTHTLITEKSTESMTV